MSAVEDAWGPIFERAAAEAMPDLPHLQYAGAGEAAEPGDPEQGEAPPPAASLQDDAGPVLWAAADDAAMADALPRWLAACAQALGLDATPGEAAAPEADALCLRFGAGAAGEARLWVRAGALGALGPAAADFPELAAGERAGVGAGIDLLLDVPMVLSVELGRAERQIRDVLALAPGSILELNRLAGEPVDLLVNGRLIAHAEVVVVDENFGVRITDIVSPVERIGRLAQR